MLYPDLPIVNTLCHLHSLYTHFFLYHLTVGCIYIYHPLPQNTSLYFLSVLLKNQSVMLIFLSNLSSIFWFC